MNDMPIWSNDGFDVDNNHVWFVPFEINILCKYSMKKRIVEEYFVLDDCDEGAVYNVKIWNDSIVAIPARSKNLTIFQANKIKGHKVSEKSRLEEKYGRSLIIKGSLYIFPISEPFVIKCSTDKLEKINFSYGFVTSCGLIGDEIYFTNHKNTLFKTDENFENTMRLGISGTEDICCVSGFQDTLFVLTPEGEAWSLNVRDFTAVNKIARLEEDDYWSDCIYLNEELFLFPYKDCSKIWIYNFVSKEMKYLALNRDEYFNDLWQYNSFGHPVEKDGKIYVMSPKHRAFFIIDPCEKIADRCHIFLKIGEDERLMMLKKKLKILPAVHENQFQTLGTLLDCIK